MTAAGIAPAIALARDAQAGWARVPIIERLRLVRRLRLRIVAEAMSLATAAARPTASQADILMAEVLPLAAACRFLERNAAAILRARRVRWWQRPFWLLGTTLRIARQPVGVVLVVGPANYPLFLPAVQAVQAVVAGNAAVLKPAHGCAGPLLLFARLFRDAGLDPDLLPVLDDTVATGRAAVDADGVDMVIMTGSLDSGRHVAAALAPRLRPAIMELSGDDALLVLPGADLAAVATAIRYGVALNGGATCIAPGRVIAVGATAELLRPHWRPGWPPLIEALDTDAAIAAANESPCRLGATVFGPADAARACADQLRAGCVVINDMIAPTADPALPFAAAGASGYGVTRGAEGLLACTRPRAVVTRRRIETRHLRTLDDAHAGIAANIIAVFYGSMPGRLRGILRLIRDLRTLKPGARAGSTHRPDAVAADYDPVPRRRGTGPS